VAWGRKRATSRSAEQLERAWRRSLRAAVDEDWLAAEAWLERIVDADSQDLDAYHALARLYRRQGAVGRAIRMHQNLLLRPDLPAAEHSEALFELGRDFEAGGFTERAAASYEEVLDREPRHLEALSRVIPLLQGHAEHTRALALTKRLRRRSPERAAELETGVLLDQARHALDDGRHDIARKALKRLLRRDKNCAPAWAMLGELEIERGKSTRALEAWKHAVNAEPELCAELYPKIDAGYAARGKAQDFDAFLRQVLADRPQDASARIALARSLAARGRVREAIEELARAIEVSPDALSLRAELGRQLLATDQDSEALKAYAELIDRIEEIERGPVEQEELV
jgi:lipopolysaccharide biosynthesis regulator YciM